MDYVLPPDQMAEILDVAKIKAGLTVRSMLIRGAMSGMVLAFAIMFALKCTAGLEKPLTSLIGSLIFPAGFAIITLLALELVTGNYAVVTLGYLRGVVSGKLLIRNLFWVGLGNLVGSILSAYFVSYILLADLHRGHSDSLGSSIVALSELKTRGFDVEGGWVVAAGKGVLCNILVGLAAILSLTSPSSTGRLASLWFPVAMFFALGFEHSVVNMFIIPCGIMLGAQVTVSDWIVHNLIPVSLGNILGAALIVAGGIHWSTPKSNDSTA